MPLRLVALVAALLAGLVWLYRWVSDGPSALHWVGLGLLAVVVAVIGAGLVSSSALPLRLVVAVAFPLLVLSLVELLRPQPDSTRFDAILGALVLLGAGGALLTTPHRETSHGRRRAG